MSQSIEPTYQNLYVKSNLSGEFTVINPYLVRDLKARDLWDSVMINDLKYYDGSVQPSQPSRLKAVGAITNMTGFHNPAVSSTKRQAPHTPSIPMTLRA